MYHNDTEFSWQDMLKWLVVVIILFIAVYFFTTLGGANKTEAPVSSGQETLGQQLIFPRGWHLASSYAYAFQAQGPYIVYVCQKDTNSSMYRICTPKTVEEENGSDSK